MAPSRDESSVIAVGNANAQAANAIACGSAAVVAEESAGVLLVGHNPVLSALWTILQGGSSGQPLVMRTSQLVCLDVFALSHDGGVFVYTVEP